MSYLQNLQMESNGLNSLLLGAVLVAFVLVVLGIGTACSPVSFQENRLKARFDRLGLTEHTLETEDVAVSYTHLTLPTIA